MQNLVAEPMEKRLQDQSEVRTQFEADISRYRELTASHSSG